ncbi:MAG: phenylalanine--tRNA ligase subunit beta [bacterium]|nr:phenylalanine--tRNA ligase subunit beta [bacterium]
MDFKLSYNWLKEFVDVQRTPEELAGLLSLHTMSVERWSAMGEGLDAKVVVGRIETIAPHPNADKLKIVTVATSTRRGGTHQVVCGGSNLLEGMLVAFAPIGATVRWHGEGEPVVLESAEIRGERSEGMICAASEIGLREVFPAFDARAILDVTPLVDASAVGKSLAEVLGYDDTVFDVEVTTNRPDCMSVMGLAREVAAITSSSFRPSPRVEKSHQTGRRDLSTSLRSARDDRGLDLRIHVEDAARCPMYTATVIDGVTVAPSPAWVQQRLLAGGVRPINNIVDATNYILLETGQPLHAFDAQRLSFREVPDEKSHQTHQRHKQQHAGNLEINVRNAKKGERILALDGEQYTLTPDMLVIADAKQPIAIAGVMGGAETGVTDATTTIILEAATFDPVSIRSTWRALDLRTEASIRYEKGVPVESVAEARERAVALILEIAGGHVVGKPVSAGKQPPAMKPITLHLARASAIIGAEVSAKRAKQVLEALGCTVVAAASPATLRVTPPWWRRGDVEAEHDLIEELARIYGYHELPSVLPEGVLPAAVYPPTPPTSSFDWEDRARTALADIGAVEVMAFSMTSTATLMKCGMDAGDAVALENPLTDDLTHLRPSLLPTMLEIIAQNQGETPSGTVFELGNIYAWNGKRGTLPTESPRLLIARYGKEEHAGALVREMQGIINHLLASLAVWPSPSSRGGAGGGALWHPGRTAELHIANTPIATLGELHPAITTAFGIDGRVVAAEIDWAALLPYLGTRKTPARPPEHPAVKRDLAFVLDQKTPHADIVARITTATPLLESAELFDHYEGTGIPSGKKSLAFHLTYRAPGRTLTTDEVEAAHTTITHALAEAFNATLRE